MKSITACPHCTTQFLVDEEQLIQYGGKVRCGSCLSVFNAVDYIVTSETAKSTPEEDTATQSSEKATEPKEEVTETLEKAPVEAVEPEVEETTPEAVKTNEVDSVAVQDETTPEPIMDAETQTEVDQAFIDKTQMLIQDIDMHNIEPDDDPKPAIDNAEKNADTSNVEADDSLQDEFAFKAHDLPPLDELRQEVEAANDYAAYDLPQEPSFTVMDEPEASITELSTDPVISALPEEETVQSEDIPFALAEKEKGPSWLKWLALLLILLLAGQLAYYLRDNIAQSFPATKPFLKDTCEMLGCKINLPKNIQLFSIDDSSIQEDAKRQGVIRLSSTLTNRADFNQAHPKLEVTLTDTKDVPKIRRIFEPNEYITEEISLEDGMAPGDSISIDMPLLTDDVKVSGFRILLTY